MSNNMFLCELTQMNLKPQSKVQESSISDLVLLCDSAWMLNKTWYNGHSPHIGQTNRPLLSLCEKSEISFTETGVTCYPESPLTVTGKYLDLAKII